MCGRACAWVLAGTHNLSLRVSSPTRLSSMRPWHNTAESQHRPSPQHGEGSRELWGMDVRPQQLAMWAHIRKKAHTRNRFRPPIQVGYPGWMDGGTMEQMATNSSDRPSVEMGRLPTKAPIRKKMELCGCTPRKPRGRQHSSLDPGRPLPRLVRGAVPKATLDRAQLYASGACVGQRTSVLLNVLPYLSTKFCFLGGGSDGVLPSSAIAA